MLFYHKDYNITPHISQPVLWILLPACPWGSGRADFSGSHIERHIGLRVGQGDVGPIGADHIVPVTVIGGKAGQGGGTHQLINAVRLHQKFGVWHLLPAQGVPEAQFRSQQEVVATGYLRGFGVSLAPALLIFAALRKA